MSACREWQNDGKEDTGYKDKGRINAGNVRGRFHLKSKDAVLKYAIEDGGVRGLACARIKCMNRCKRVF